VQAVRSSFAAFRGEAPLAFAGDHYQLSLLPAMWSPGPIDVPDPPIDLAAVNPWMMRMASEVADGVHVHPLNTPTYLRETVLPNLDKPMAVFLPLFTAVGDTDQERARWRESSRGSTAFYGSTPNYAFIFDQIGFPGTTDRLRAAQKAGDLAGMPAVIDDDILAHFVVEGSWDELPGRIAERCQPVVDAGHEVHVVLYLAGMAAARPDDSFERFGAVARQVAAMARAQP
jgi:hypothetical protein